MNVNRHVEQRRLSPCRGFRAATLRQAGTPQHPGAPSNFRGAILRRAGGVQCGGGTPTCWAALPNLPGITMANWPLQNSFADISGNGLTFAPVAASTNLPVADPPFIAIANRNLGVVTPVGCMVGVQLEAETKLMAPLTPLLQLTGPMTIQWVMMQRFTFTFAYFACADPAGRSGGRAPDRIGSLYTYWTGSGDPAVSDGFIGSNLPSPGYGSFPGYNDHTLFNWADAGQPQVGDWHAHTFAVARDGGGNYRALRDGVVVGAGVLTAGHNVASGLEQFFLGNIELTFPGAGGGAVYASVRVLNVNRSNADLRADTTYINGS